MLRGCALLQFPLTLMNRHSETNCVVVNFCRLYFRRILIPDYLKVETSRLFLHNEFHLKLLKIFARFFSDRHSLYKKAKTITPYKLRLLWYYYSSDSCLFVLMPIPINNVWSCRDAYVDQTSTKQRLTCLAEGHNTITAA